MRARAVLVALCAGLLACASGPRITGRVVARDMDVVFLRPVSFVPSQEILALRVTCSASPCARYAKVVYEWMPGDKAAELPADMLDGLRDWTIPVIRDQRCDGALANASPGALRPGIRFLDVEYQAVSRTEILPCYHIANRKGIRRAKTAQQGVADKTGGR